MAATPYLYTNSDAVRVALGVTSIEVPDSVMDSSKLEDQLKFSLEAVYPDHAALSVNHTSTADERLFDALELFCQYEGALLLAPAYQAMMWKKLSDGDADNQRFEANFDKTLDRLTAARNKYAGILMQGAGTSSPGATLGWGLAKPDYDPVTNSGSII